MNVNWQLITYGLIGLVAASLLSIFLYQAHAIKLLRVNNASCEAQIQLQNAAVALAKKQTDLMQQKIIIVQNSYEAQLSQRDKRASEIDNTPIIDDCTGAVKWGSKKSADLAASWADRD